MLVILTEEQILDPHIVCQGCLLADQTGSPRWRQGKLCCGKAIDKIDGHHPSLYQCQMGFRLTNID